MSKSRTAKAAFSRTDREDVRFGGLLRISILTAITLASITVFIILWVKGLRTSRANYWSSLYLAVPLVGSLTGAVQLRQIQPQHRYVPVLFRLGLLAWAVGCMIWLFYNLTMGEAVPYPSWADAGYLIALGCWTVGIALLYRQVRGDEVLRDLAHLVPLGVVATTVTVGFIYWAHGGEISRFSPANEIFKYLLDLSYPVVDAINLAFFLTLLAGKRMKKLKDMKKGLWIIFAGYCLVFCSDLAFNISTSLPPNSSLAYFNGGPTDAIFTIAFYVMSIGLLSIPNYKAPPKSRRTMRART